MVSNARDPLHNSGEAVAVGSGWAARRLFAANSKAIGKKNNAVDRPSPADHKPQGVMQRVPRGAIQALHEPDACYLISPTLVDSCVLIDVLANDPDWADWSLGKLDLLGQQAPLVINPIILAEISPRFECAADLDTALSQLPIKREALPWDAAYLAGQAFKIYRSAKGAKRSPMPDFYIGAHALVGNMRLLTRDAVRFHSYFPKLHIISP